MSNIKAEKPPESDTISRLKKTDPRITQDVVDQLLEEGYEAIQKGEFARAEALLNAADVLIPKDAPNLPNR